MKLFYLKLLLLACILVVSCCEGITSEEIVGKLECVNYCHRVHHRSCQQVPDQCGKCVLLYYDFAGVCKKKNQGQEEYHQEFKKALMVDEEERGENDGGQYKEGLLGSSIMIHPRGDEKYWDIIIIAIMCSVSVVLLVAIVLTIVCVCRLRSRRLSKEMPYQTFYGTTLKGPANGPATGDRKLAYSAQMYHYQYQKQQMLANEKANGFDQKNPSGNSTDDEVVDDDDTVYECPGLANTEGEMEVTNPYFVDQDNQANKQP